MQEEDQTLIKEESRQTNLLHLSRIGDKDSEDDDSSASICNALSPSSVASSEEVFTPHKMYSGSRSKSSIGRSSEKGQLNVDFFM